MFHNTDILNIGGSFFALIFSINFTKTIFVYIINLIIRIFLTTIWVTLKYVKRNLEYLKVNEILTSQLTYLLDNITTLFEIMFLSYFKLASHFYYIYFSCFTISACFEINLN